MPKIRSYELCAFGNCQEEGRRVIVTHVSDGLVRSLRRFCSFTHAGQWALKQAAYYQGEPKS